MTTLYDLINKISEFPEIYIGNRSLERLYAFIGGFLYQNDDANDHCLDGFTEYVAEKYHQKSDHNWSSIIQFYSNNEEDAFARFVELFREFTDLKKED